MARTKDPALEARRRAQVVQAAFRLLTRTSFQTVTFERVAREASVSKGLVTYYFPTKDDLVIATIRHYHALQHAMLGAIVAADAPTETLLERLVDAAFPGRESVEDELRFQVEVWSFAKERPDALAAVAESYRGFRAACEALLDRGVAEGRVTARDREWAYLLMHALVDGLSFQLAVDPDLPLDALRERLVRVLRLLLAGAADAPA